MRSINKNAMKTRENFHSYNEEEHFEREELQ